jgi:hypothetical protein
MIIIGFTINLKIDGKSDFDLEKINILEKRIKIIRTTKDKIKLNKLILFAYSESNVVII